ncbi:MAG TPA: hypothetical protein VL485_22015 [Ktedonobacteraceae bacterium]|jgi:hypothetical protein|nr:hypothetical protein [Ktedonobacteraceae bacterium]
MPERSKALFQWQKVSGQSLVVNDLTLTPQSQVLVVRFPWSAFVWQRPTAILVERNGQVERLSIVDRTRSIQLGLWGLGVIIFTVVNSIRLARRKKHDS